MALRKEDLGTQLSLLEKTRRLNLLLQKNGGPVEFPAMAKVLSELIWCNAYLVDLQGELLGYAFQDGFECQILLDTVIEAGRFPPEYNSSLLECFETVPNLNQEGKTEENLGCFFLPGATCFLSAKLTTIVPINGGGERLATLLLAKFSQSFVEADLILAEYGAAVVGMEILRARSGEREEEARRKVTVGVAVGSLSFSEREAMRWVFEELGAGDGLLVASKIADRMGITRSVIVNGLRKLESAGLIAARSLGMKGTHIQILNPFLFDVIRQ